MITTGLAIAVVLLGALIIFASVRPVVIPNAEPAARNTARERAHVAHRFGLAHRLACRLLQARLRPADENFVDVAELYLISRRGHLSLLGARGAAVVEAGDPLLDLEELLERMDVFTARVRSWRPGRARGKR